MELRDSQSKLSLSLIALGGGIAWIDNHQQIAFFNALVIAHVQPGTLVQAGTALFSLVSPNVWVVANFKESQLERMKPGDKVTVSVDAWPDMALEGHVDSIQQGSGSRFSAFPAENATGNFVKIVQRVPVKIVIDKGLDPNKPLPLGLSVAPKVTVE